jgi:hypothetical protein
LRSLLQSNVLLKFIPVFNCFKSAEVEPIIVIAKKKDAGGINYNFDFIDNRYNRVLNADENVYNVDISLYRNAVNNVFFVPNKLNLEIYSNYNNFVNTLIGEYWDKINTSKQIEKNQSLLKEYAFSLRPGSKTLLGMVTDGGQGLATANNGKYIGVLEGTKSANNTLNSRPQKLLDAIKKNKISDLPQIKTKEEAITFLNTKTEREIREIFDTLKEKYGRDIFGQGYLFRIVSINEIADINKIICEEKLNGIIGEKTFVPYDKGDKEGNQWVLRTPYFIDWNKENVSFLQTDSRARWQGYQFYFREGFCWNDVLNPKSVLIKSRIKGVSVNDIKSMCLYPSCGIDLSSKYFVCLLNSSLLYHYVRNFVNNTVSVQMNDVRQLPVIIPTKEQMKEYELLFNEASLIKEDLFNNIIEYPESEVKLEKIQKKLDKNVSHLYGINQDLIDEEILKIKSRGCGGE